MIPKATLKGAIRLLVAILSQAEADLRAEQAKSTELAAEKRALVTLINQSR